MSGLSKTQQAAVAATLRLYGWTVIAPGELAKEARQPEPETPVKRNNRFKPTAATMAQRRERERALAEQNAQIMRIREENRAKGTRKNRPSKTKPFKGD